MGLSVTALTEANAFTAAIFPPASGTPVAAADVQAGLQALANRTKWLSVAPTFTGNVIVGGSLVADGIQSVGNFSVFGTSLVLGAATFNDGIAVTGGGGSAIDELTVALGLILLAGNFDIKSGAGFILRSGATASQVGNWDQQGNHTRTGTGAQAGGRQDFPAATTGTFIRTAGDFDTVHVPTPTGLIIYEIHDTNTTTVDGYEATFCNLSLGAGTGGVTIRDAAAVTIAAIPSTKNFTVTIIYSHSLNSGLGGWRLKNFVTI